MLINNRCDHFKNINKDVDKLIKDNPKMKVGKLIKGRGANIQLLMQTFLNELRN